MYYIEKIIMEAGNYLNSKGWLLLEMGPEQTSKALELIDEAQHYKDKRRIKDYAHHYRVVMARKK